MQNGFKGKNNDLIVIVVDKITLQKWMLFCGILQDLHLGWNFGIKHITWTLIQNIASLQMQAPLPLIQGFGHA
jgi:hypothetical protein